jgi:hypothetical protein
MKKIKSISPKSFAKVLGLVYGFLGIIGGVMFLLLSILSKGNAWAGLLVAVVIPVFYGVMGFVLGYIAAWAYNMVAKKFGGLEFEIE